VTGPKRPFQLDVLDIHAPGNEKWSNKYRYWIPALSIDAKEVLKGRWTASDVEKALDEWERGDEPRGVE